MHHGFKLKSHGHNGPSVAFEVKFLTVADGASVMRVSKMTVYRLVLSGELPAVRVGRRPGAGDAVDDYSARASSQTG